MQSDPSPVEKRRVRRGVYAGHVTVIPFGLRVARLLRMLHPRVLLQARLRQRRLAIEIHLSNNETRDVNLITSRKEESEIAEIIII